MKIYIASSWKNQHAVEMLTYLLRQAGHDVISFVEHNISLKVKPLEAPSERWPYDATGLKCFAYDTHGATESDLVVYVAPSGKDAAAECGMAHAKGIPLLGLWAKGEDFGLMELMFGGWIVSDYRELLAEVRKFELKKKKMEAAHG